MLLPKPLVKVAKRLHRNPRHFERFAARHKGRKFFFNGEQLEYLWHANHWTWLNERCIEIPLARHHFEQHRGQSILEVGNVLWKYFPTSHPVVDKYETGQGDHVINQDILDYHPGVKYDFIISVSTIEHIGWDEENRDATKIPRTIDHLKTLLNPGGRIVLTFPMGYNRFLDEMMRASSLTFDQQFFFKRSSWQNDWSQVPFESVSRVRYGYPYYYANGIVLGLIDG